MSEKRFELDSIGIFDNKTNHFYYKTFDNEEVVDLLNKLQEENKKLKAVLERKETLLKIRTEDNEKIMKSIHQLIIYLENSVYKSDVSAIAVKKDIISLIKKWEVR